MSDKYAIVRTGGKQFGVKAGTKFSVNKISGEVGDTVTLTDVLMLSEGGSVKVGSPLLSGVKVTAKIVSHKRAKKVVIYKKKITHGYTKKQGHRQDETQLVVESIAA